jgi:hypothetical protein
VRTCDAITSKLTAESPISNDIGTDAANAEGFSDETGRMGHMFEYIGLAS